MPVVDAGDFLGKYVQGTEHVSPILLWSVLFAAASYLDMASVKEASFTTRKSLKEYCYQNAKVTSEPASEVSWRLMSCRLFTTPSVNPIRRMLYRHVCY